MGRNQFGLRTAQQSRQHHDRSRHRPHRATDLMGEISAASWGQSSGVIQVVATFKLA
jgi:hypothetical protein